MITYKSVSKGQAVFLDGKRVGLIRPTSGSEPIGWRYTPEGQKIGGDILPRMADVKKSLEAS